MTNTHRERPVFLSL